MQDKFQNYLRKAQETNQFTNYGWVAKELEIRARDMLKIDESKTIIACCIGTRLALHAMLWGIHRDRQYSTHRNSRFCNFASNSIGPAEGPIVTGMNTDCGAA